MESKLNLWLVNELRNINQSKKGKSLQLTKGVHIVLPFSKLPIKQAVYFDAFDGRMLFAIPRVKITYVGTSDTQYNGDKDRILCTRKDAEYILNAINKMFKVKPLSKEDIISSWAGLRPLIHEDGKSPSELSRKDEIFISDTDLISIAGGKLTGFRKMAERIIDLVQKNNRNISQESCSTKSYKIHSDSFADYKMFLAYKKELLDKYRNTDISEYDIWHFTTTYGKHAEKIIDSAIESSMNIEKALIQSEIKYCIFYESCLTPDDYINRRTGRVYFDVESVKKNYNFIISEFGKHFNWTQSKLLKEKTKAQTHIDDVTIIKS